MASDDSAGSSRRCTGGPRYRALRMRAEPRLLNHQRSGLASRHARAAPCIEPGVRSPRGTGGTIATATLRWERPDQAPIARAIGNGPMGRLVVGHLREVAGVDRITIVCSCHGAPFSPAGFLEHAGAADLSYPLKRIMIYYRNLGGAGPSGAADNGGGRGQE